MCVCFEGIKSQFWMLFMLSMLFRFWRRVNCEQRQTTVIEWGVSWSVLRDWVESFAILILNLFILLSVKTSHHHYHHLIGSKSHTSDDCDWTYWIDLSQLFFFLFVINTWTRELIPHYHLLFVYVEVLLLVC